jgi:hypothetical protein
MVFHHPMTIFTEPVAIIVSVYEPIWQNVASSENKMWFKRFELFLHKTTSFSQGHLRLAHGDGVSCRVCVCSFLIFEQSTIV